VSPVKDHRQIVARLFSYEEEAHIDPAPASHKKHVQEKESKR
jgi:hypothetical protein